MPKAMRLRARLRRLRIRVRAAMPNFDRAAVALLAAPVGVALAYYASLVFWDTGPLRSQPSYVRYGLPAFFLLPFAIAYAIDRSNIRLQFVAVTTGIAATFLGTTLAFVQADIQSAANERETFSRMLEGVMDELSDVDEGREMFTEADLHRQGFVHQFDRLRALRIADLQYKFLTRPQRYELDLALRALATYDQAYRDGGRARDDRLGNRRNYFGVVDGLYANLCALRHHVRGEFDMQRVYGAIQGASRPGRATRRLPEGRVGPRDDLGTDGTNAGSPAALIEGRERVDARFT
jgi:hypothetical protein